MRLPSDYPDVLQSEYCVDLLKGRRDYSGFFKRHNGSVGVSFDPPPKGATEVERWIGFIDHYLEYLSGNFDSALDVVFDRIHALRVDFGEIGSVRGCLSDDISLSHIHLIYGEGYSLSCSILCAEYHCMDTWIHYGLDHDLKEFDVIGD